MSDLKKWIGVALIGGVLAAGSRTVVADDADAKKLEELDRKVRDLERKLEIADESSASRPKDATTVKAGKEGFWLTSDDKAFQLRVGGSIQADARFYADDSQQKISDTFLLRKVRPILEGRVYDDFGFRILPDFGNGAAVIQDAYIEYIAIPQLKLRIGKFKEPVGLEVLQSDMDATFAERGLPTQIVPGRDVGAEFYGEFASGTVSYAAGVFNGVPNGASADTDNNDGKDVAGRLFTHPFRPAGIESLANLGIGIGISSGEEQGTAIAPGLPIIKSSGQQTFFTYKNSTNINGIAFADGRNLRIAPQAYYYIGPFGILGEYVESRQDITDGKNSDSVDATAWQLIGSWVLTGEKASYKGVTPRFDFAPSAGHIGAVELVARWQDLTVDGSAFDSTLADPKRSASEAKSRGIGLNWYLNKSVKASLDYEQTAFTRGAVTGDRPDEKLVLSRIQLVF